jgi:DNA replication protein DnaC
MNNTAVQEQSPIGMTIQQAQRDIREYEAMRIVPPRWYNKPFVALNKAYASLIGEMEAYCAGFTRKHTREGLYLYSASSGTGKTHLAYHGLTLLIRNGYTARAWNVMDLFNKIKATYSDKYEGPSEDELISDAIEADMLFLDDLGVERAPNRGWVNDKLYSILNGRYEQGKPLMITANFTGDEQITHMGGGQQAERIMSRVCEMIRIPPMKFPEVDLRIKKPFEGRK